MKLMRGILGLAVAAVVAGTAAAPASAAPEGLPDPNYVALGDSYAAGVGLPDYDPASGECYRSPLAYGPKWAAEHQLASFAFVACSGATTAQVNTQTEELGTSTSLVTVSVGGNDAGFSSVLAACRFGTDAQCAGALDSAEYAIDNVIPGRLAETYGLIREKAPFAQVAVVGYPRLFELGSNCSGDSIAEDRRIRLNALADSLAEVTAAQVEAAGHGFVFVDTRPYFAGHGVCSTTPWVHALRAQSFESYHATQDGHDLGFYPALTAALS